MAKEELLEFEGEVTEELPDGEAWGAWIDRVRPQVRQAGG